MENKTKKVDPYFKRGWLLLPPTPRSIYDIIVASDVPLTAAEILIKAGIGSVSSFSDKALVATHINKIRKELGKDVIITIRGIGYLRGEK